MSSMQTPKQLEYEVTQEIESKVREACSKLLGYVKARRIRVPDSPYPIPIGEEHVYGIIGISVQQGDLYYTKLDQRLRPYGWQLGWIPRPKPDKTKGPEYLGYYETTAYLTIFPIEI